MALGHTPVVRSTLTITSGGTLVGSGAYSGRNLTLDLLSGFSGDATSTVTTRGGDTLTCAVSITAGVVRLTSHGALLKNVNPSTAARGGTVTINQVSGPLTAPTLPSGTPGPNFHSVKGIHNADAAASVGVSHASTHAPLGSGNKP